MDTSTLELRWRTRSGGSGRTERRYLDFIVDGVSLQDRLRAGDQTTPLGCSRPEYEREYLEQLRARSAPESPSGRVPIYNCAECGDLGCGAQTVVIEQTPEGFVWRDFAYEDWSEEARVDSYRGIGPFLFEAAEYLRLIEEREAALSIA